MARYRAQSGSRLFFVAIFLSGTSSIIYQLIWTRYLHHLFGVSVHAVATVLTCYMLGLVAGSLFFGRLADRLKRGHRLFLSLEASIGIYGACSPFLYTALADLNAWLASSFEMGGELRITVRIALSLLFLIIPTFLMGGTFPVMVKCHARMTAGIGKDMGSIYAVNTLGAAIGAFVTGFYLIQTIGLNQSVYMAAGLNLLVAGFLLIMRKQREEEDYKEVPLSRAQVNPPSSGSRRFVWFFGSAFAISGLTSLSYEVLWTRSLTYFFRDTVYDFALVLTVFLFGIVLGSYACSRLLHRIHRPVEAFGMVQVAIGLYSLVTLLIIHKLPYAINHLQTMSTLYMQYGDGYWLAGLFIKLGYTVLIVLIPTSLFGSTYPLIGKIFLQNADQVGKQVGLLNSLNTLGSAIGALLSGFVFVSLLGLHNSIKTLALLNCCIGFMLCVLVLPKKGRSRMKAVVAASFISVIVVAAVVPRWDHLRMSISFLEPDQALEQSVRLLYYNENSMDMVSVVEVVPYEQKFLTTNRLYTQNTSNMGQTEDHRRLGHIPLLLHPDPKNVLVVGLGAGMTLSGVGEQDVGRIDAVEISKNVVNAARLFEEENNGILDDPRVRIHIDDGRNFVRSTRDAYDVIISDIYFPMSSGSGSLYSTDYYRAVRERLAPDGLFVQWLPIHQLSFADMKMIIRSFREEFPNTSLWYGMIGDSAPVLGVMGMNHPLAVDYGQLDSRMKQPVLHERLQEMNLSTPSLLLSHFIMGSESVDELVCGYPVNTDNKPIIEYTAPRLHNRSYQTGLANISQFPDRTESVFPYLTNIRPEEAAQIQSHLTDHTEAKKSIIRALTPLVEGQWELSFGQINEAVQQYRDNEDLLYWQREIARRQ
ncbi:spermidine synthase [Paenibacillus phyllosphaerae]|uniref:Polyamine aminopropyltransferase n=1 Tax=Paenibacillus phyllosphaerae TaxID=274593 RepID=A0A7W5AST2_9BACL|nr:fused MFS/spermidine synthase [Paenibacillus phyllosphaerae]MBB3108120.1 spermidine synthase [Paenibacillus phyllosphaerae]